MDVEAISVQDLEAMRCVFALILAAAQSVFCLIDQWPPEAVKWVRELRGKLGNKQDRDGPYIFLQGLVALYQTWLTLSFVMIQSFPHPICSEVVICVSTIKNLLTRPLPEAALYN